MRNELIRCGDEAASRIPSCYIHDEGLECWCVPHEKDGVVVHKPKDGSEVFERKTAEEVEACDQSIYGSALAKSTKGQEEGFLYEIACGQRGCESKTFRSEEIHPDALFKVTPCETCGRQKYVRRA